MVDCAHQILNMNPTPPLGAGADVSAHSQAEREEHFLQGTSSCREHDSDSQVDRPDACLSSRFGRAFPLTAHFGQKAMSRRTGFTQDFIVAIAVVARSRC